jgi:hypothetical protein
MRAKWLPVQPSPYLEGRSYLSLVAPTVFFDWTDLHCTSIPKVVTHLGGRFMHHTSDTGLKT